MNVWKTRHMLDHGGQPTANSKSLGTPSETTSQPRYNWKMENKYWCVWIVVNNKCVVRRWREMRLCMWCQRCARCDEPLGAAGFDAFWWHNSTLQTACWCTGVQRQGWRPQPPEHYHMDTATCEAIVIIRQLTLHWCMGCLPLLLLKSVNSQPGNSVFICRV